MQIRLIYIEEFLHYRYAMLTEEQEQRRNRIFRWFHQNVATKQQRPEFRIEISVGRKFS